MRKALVGILFMLHVFCYCQDNNYWNMQFGAKSALLGGAVVGEFADNGAMYYNPGSLQFKDSSNINVSANLYKVERMRIKNALGDGINTTSYNFDVTPQLVSGTKKLGKHVTIGVVLLTHNDVDISFQQSYSASKSIYPQDSVFKRNYIGDFDYRNRLNEQWLGFCMAFQLNPKLAIGFTHFFNYRFQRFSQHISASAISTDTVSSPGFTTQYDYMRDIRYDVISALAKFGLMYRPNPKLSMGLTATMSSGNLFGRGKTYTKIYSSNLAYNQYDSYTVFDRQRGLNAQYQTPFSLALGIKASLGRLNIHASGEYFAPLEQYDIINPTDSLNINKSGVEYNSSDLLGVTYSAQQILNGALGLEYSLSKNFRLLGSFRTDFNTQKNKITSQDNSSIVTSYIDLYHATLGCSVQKNKKSYIVGVSYSFGELMSQKQFADFDYPTDASNLLGQSFKKAKYYYKSLGLIFGITL
jgi:hypothetical protein